MCVIIVRNPEVVIPPAKIESACHVNSDGWGMSVIDRGKIETVKLFDRKGNDPDIVNKMLEEAAKHRVYLHLRFATKGLKNEQNCHPFSIFKDDDYELMLMHNGTLGEFGDDKMTDSEAFGREIVAPLVERTRFMTDNPLGDDYVRRIIKKYAGLHSKIVLYDNEGRDLIHGDDKDATWHDEGGWWASNVYSFNRTHREPSYANSDYYQSWKTRNAGGGAANSDVPFQIGRTNLPAIATTAIAPATPALSGGTGANGATSTASTSTQTAPASFPRREPVDPQPTLGFTDITGLTHLSEVVDFTDEHIYELLDDKEIAMTLIRDLIYELYMRDTYGEDD